MRRTSPFVTGLVLAALLTAVSVFAVPAHAQRGENPFAAMIGSWSGGGTLSLSNGTRERIRCRANYQGGGATMSLELRCASDSYRFELASNVSNNDGDLSGTWSEATRGAGGNISGTINRGRIQARAVGAGFSASLALSTAGSKQSIVIQSPGSELEQVNISLNRTR